MSNPLGGMPFSTPMQNGLNMSKVQQVAGMFKQIQTAANPQAAFANLCKQNPQIGQMAQQPNLQQAFYAMCKQQGVDPNTILNSLR